MDNVQQQLTYLRQAVEALDVNARSTTSAHFTSFFNSIAQIQEHTSVTNGSNKELQELIALITEKFDKFQVRRVADDHWFQYDYGSFSIDFDPWYRMYEEDLNVEFDAELYPLILRDWVLPQFYPLPQGDVQYPVLATQILTNAVAVPPENDELLMSIPVALNCFVGASGTNKSQSCKFALMHHGLEQQLFVKEGWTGYNIIKEISRVCKVSGRGKEVILRPGAALFDNIYWGEWIDRVEHHYSTILCIERSDGVIQIGIQGKEGFGTFYTFGLTKWITTVESPVRSRLKMDELMRRMFFFLTKRNDPYLPRETGNYNWSQLKDYYRMIWSKERVESQWFAVLQEVLKLKSLGNIYSTQSAISKLNLAVGVYTGIYPSIHDGIEILENYWYYVNRNLSDTNLLHQIVRKYLKEQYYDVMRAWRLNMRNETEILKLCKIQVDEFFKYVERESGGLISFKKEKTVQEVREMLELENLVIQHQESGVYFVDRRLSESAQILSPDSKREEV